MKDQRIYHQDLASSVERPHYRLNQGDGEIHGGYCRNRIKELAGSCVPPLRSNRFRG